MAIKYIPAKAMNETADYVFTRYCVEIPPNITLEDLFRPVVWSHFSVGNKLKKYDIVRCIAENGGYDIDLTVREVEVGGVHMIPRPHVGGKAGADAMSQVTKVAEKTIPTVVPLDRDGKPVVRVEFLPATKWRVIGHEGGEVSRGHKTEADAIKEMNRYLKSAGLVMPKMPTDEKEVA